MLVTKTAKCRITAGEQDVKRTVAVCREALAHILSVVVAEWRDISRFDKPLERRRACELLLVTNKRGQAPAGYDLAAKFHKLPSYLRRALITEAIGTYASHLSRFAGWREAKAIAFAAGRKFTAKPPRLNAEPQAWTTFYRGNMFEGELADFAGKKELYLQLKLYDGREWVWRDVAIDAKPLRKRGLAVYQPQAPTAVKSARGWSLHIPWQREVALPKLAEPREVRVCSVDLNVDNDAVMAVMDGDGTVHARKFLACDKDRLVQAIDRVSAANQKSGAGPKPNLWRRVNNLKDELVNTTVNAIVAFALEHGCHVIAMENLKSLKPGNKRRERVHHWRVMAISRALERAAHHAGLRLSRVNPRNTSRLAFDGSGKAERPQNGKTLVFTSGKRYNADLNAAYNIGARWFVRAFFNMLPKQRQKQLRAKAPALQPGSGTTLDTLRTGWAALPV